MHKYTKKFPRRRIVHKIKLLKNRRLDDRNCHEYPKWLTHNLLLEYCFAREKEIVFAQQKQSVPMNINDFVEMTIFLCLIYFSICAKIKVSYACVSPKYKQA